jgi:hypothetical protein
MSRLLVALACSLACGSRTTPKPQDKGDVGATCHCHERGLERATCVAVECKPELVCGYPCGIDGCDSVCMKRGEPGGPKIP